MANVSVQLKDGTEYHYEDGSVEEPEGLDVVKVYGRSKGDEQIDLKLVAQLSEINELVVR